jgi:hypothetical protein
MRGPPASPGPAARRPTVAPGLTPVTVRDTHRTAPRSGDDVGDGRGLGRVPDPRAVARNSTSTPSPPTPSAISATVPWWVPSRQCRRRATPSGGEARLAGSCNTEGHAGPVARGPAPNNASTAGARGLCRLAGCSDARLRTSDERRAGVAGGCGGRAMAPVGMRLMAAGCSTPVVAWAEGTQRACDADCAGASGAWGFCGVCEAGTLGAAAGPGARGPACVGAAAAFARRVDWTPADASESCCPGVWGLARVFAPPAMSREAVRTPVVTLADCGPALWSKLNEIVLDER